MKKLTNPKFIAGVVLITMLMTIKPLSAEDNAAITPEGSSTAGMTALGQKPGTSTIQRPLSLDDCIRIAIARNPQQEAARQGLIAAGEAVGEKRAPYFPQVDLAVGYARRETHAFLPQGLSLPDKADMIGPTDDWSSGIIGHLILFDSGKRRAELLAAMANKKIAKEESSRMQQNIILNAHRAFYGLAAALENRAVIGKALDRAVENLRVAEERHAAGDVPLADSLRARVEKSDAILSRVRGDSLIQIARGNLNQAMGLAVAMEIEIVVPQVVVPALPPTLAEDAIHKAVDNRPETRAARQHQEMAGQSVAAAKSAFGPKLAAKAQYGYRDDTFTPTDQDWFAGVNLEIPVFSGFAKSHALDRKRAELSSVRAERVTIEQSVSQEVWDSYWRLREKHEAIGVADTLLADATESLRMARERYENGVGTIADLLAAQSTLSKAETVHVVSRWDYEIAHTELQRAMGELKGDNYSQGITLSEQR